MRPSWVNGFSQRRQQEALNDHYLVHLRHAPATRERDVRYLGWAATLITHLGRPGTHSANSASDELLLISTCFTEEAWPIRQTRSFATKPVSSLMSISPFSRATGIHRQGPHDIIVHKEHLSRPGI